MKLPYRYLSVPALASVFVLGAPADTLAQGAANYPSKPIRIIVPFAEGGAPGLVSRRPVRGEGAQSAGFYRVAAVTAETYPTKPIRLIVPFAPGGPNDALARIIGQKLTETWGQSLVIENRGGAGGTVGAEVAAKAPPDGYTLAMGGSSNLAMAPGLYAKLPYDSIRDFAAVANVAHVPYAVAVNPGVPAKNIKELIILAQTKKDYLSYGSSGTGSVSSLAAELFASMIGTNIVHVPYKGTAPALTEIIAGQVDMMFADLAVILPHAKTGKLRAIAVTGIKRSRIAPELLTVAESGLPGYDISPWFGIVTAAGAPRDIVLKLNGAIVQALKSPDVLKRLEQFGYEPIGGTPEQFAATIRADITKYAKIIRQAGIKAEL
jgi:tripartite-type tricarboxylate transporter receptor subunit TctC